jgi:dienelactone hydrolase
MARRLASFIIAGFLSASSPSQAQQLPGPYGPEEGPLRHQLWLVPSAVPNVEMQTSIVRPAGKGPFPLVVINHGTTSNEEERLSLPPVEFDLLSAWFVRHGYVVAMPQRPGHGATGGPYLETIESCDRAEYERAGLGAAASIETALHYLTSQPFVRKTGVVLVGQSAGGWGSLATASRNPPGLAAVINFAGGLGGHAYGKPNRNCAPDRLVNAAAAYGQTSRVPTLWIYAANDTYFNAGLSARMADAFRAAGGLADYHLLPALGEEGHYLVFYPEAVRNWVPLVAKFLHIPVR